MANKGLSMRKVREVLRLHHVAGLSGRAIARSLKVSPATARKYIDRAEEQGLGWPLPESPGARSAGGMARSRLLTVKAPNVDLRPRARQNVVFEFGYFIGRPGRERVCALAKGDIERPSDSNGILYVPLDDNDGWKMRLLRELKAADFDMDANQALSA